MSTSPEVEAMAAQLAALGFVVVSASQFREMLAVVEAAVSLPFNPEVDLQAAIARWNYHDRPALGRLSREDEVRHQRIVEILSATRAA